MYKSREAHVKLVQVSDIRFHAHRTSRSDSESFQR
jgi:hypothetical protein